MTGKSFTQALVDSGRISEAALQAIQALPQSHRHSIERLLVDQGHISEADMVIFLAETYDLPVTLLLDKDTDANTIDLLSRQVIERLGAFPMRVVDGKLMLAMIDPLDVV